MRYYIKEINGALFLANKTDDFIPPSPSTAIRGIMNQYQLDRPGLAAVAGVPPELVARWLAGGAVPTQKVLQRIKDYKPSAKPAPEKRTEARYILDDTLEFINTGDQPTTDASAITGIMEDYQWDRNELADLLDCSPITVRSWLSGTREMSDIYREKLYEHLAKYPPKSRTPKPRGTGVQLRNVLAQPNYRQRAKGHDHGHRQLIMYYARLLDARRGLYSTIPVMSITWTKHKRRSICNVRTLLEHPTHDLSPHNGRAEAATDRDALYPALRAAGYRLNEAKRPIGQLIYLGRHLISPTEERALRILCHRCSHGRNHPYEVFGGGPVRPSHVPDFQ